EGEERRRRRRTKNKRSDEEESPREKKQKNKKMLSTTTENQEKVATPTPRVFSRFLFPCSLLFPCARPISVCVPRSRFVFSILTRKGKNESTFFVVNQHHQLTV